MITFYDIPSTLGRAWSPNTWKTRLCLNYKGLAHKTEWVEFPDIASLSKEKGFVPTTAPWAPTEPYFSLPAIVDTPSESSSFRAAVAESYEIAKYLDAAYPETKRIVPEGEEAEAFQKEFAAKFRALVYPAIAPIFVPRVWKSLNPASQPYFDSKRAPVFFKKDSLSEVVVSEEEAKGIWDKLEQGFTELEDYYRKTDEKGPWLLGDVVSFGDFIIVAFLICFCRLFGEDSEEWLMVRRWNGGRWSRLYDEAAYLMEPEL